MAKWLIGLTAIAVLLIAATEVNTHTPISWRFTHPITDIVREKVRIDQQPIGDKNPGAGIITVESGDDNRGNGFRTCSFTHRQNVGTIRCSGPNGDGMEFEFADGVPTTPAWLSVKDGDGASAGAFIQARNMNDSLGFGVSFEDPAHPFVGTIEKHVALTPVEAVHVRNTQPGADIALTLHDPATGGLIDRLYVENDGDVIIATGAAPADPTTTRDDAALTIQADGSNLYVDYVAENPNQDIRQCFRDNDNLFCHAQVLFRLSTGELHLMVGSLAPLILRSNQVEFARPPRIPLHETTGPLCNADMAGGLILWRVAGQDDALLVCGADSQGVFSWRSAANPSAVISVEIEVKSRTFALVEGKPAQDLDGDGLFEDLNGNGRLDFADVLLLYRNLASPVILEHAGLVDFNGGGRLDLADMVVLFEKVVQQGT